MDAEAYIELARQHGEDSELDHEVGDLQELFRAAWEVMSEGQRRQFAGMPEVVTVVMSARGDAE